MKFKAKNKALKNLFLESTRFKLWKSLDKPYRDNNKALSSNIVKVTKQIFDEIEENFSSNLDYLGVAKSLEDNNFTFFDIDKFKALLQSETLTTRERIAIESILVTLNSIDIETGIAEIREQFREQIKRTLQLNGIKLTMAIDTINKRLLDILQRGLLNAEGLTGNEIREILDEELKVLRTEYTKQSYVINAITTTVTTNLVNENYRSVHSRLNLGSQWVSQRDGRVRDSHRLADGQIVAKGEMFRVGNDTMAYPAGGAVANENINCRCYIRAVKLK